MIGPLLVDVYAEDVNGHPDVPKLVDAGLPWMGISLKVSQGCYYNGGDWLKKYWDIARKAAGSRYGDTFFRMGYHYADLTGKTTGVQQWNYFRQTVIGAGGFGNGDLPVGIDVEAASNPPASPAQAQRIIQIVSEFAELALTYTGQPPICYGGSYLRDNQIKSHMKCQAPWVAEYGPKLDPGVYTSIGYPDWKSVLAWQYDSTEGFTGPTGYPKVSPMGHTDISALVIDGGGDASMTWCRGHRIQPRG